MMRTLPPLLLAALLWPAVLLAGAPAARLALVIGSNAPLPGRDQALRFADDDAYQSAQVLGGAGVEVWLHTEFDAETAARTQARGFVGTPRAPSLQAIRHSVAEMRQRVEAARGRGEQTSFYFWYAGHGDVVDGEGVVSLSGDVLRRSVLWRDVIGGVGADVNHVVVDACRAYYVVFDRGVTAPRRPLRELAVAPIPEDLARRTGVLLASAGGEQSYEWEALRSGIFGHEVRSGLSGAADVDGDGEVSYLELASFVASANSALPDPAYRPQVTIRPPQHQQQLLDLHDHPGATIVLEPGFRQHLYIEDALGMRWIDLHPSGAGEVQLRLPLGTRPGYLVAALDRTEAPLHSRVHQVVSPKQLRPRRSASRGAAADAFDQLFGRPHGPDELARFDGTEAGQQARQPFVDLVASIDVDVKVRVKAAPARREVRPAQRRIVMRQRATSLLDHLPFGAGGHRFIAEPQGAQEPRFVELYQGGRPLAYDSFAQLVFSADERQRMQQETEELYGPDRLRAWCLIGGGTALLAAGTGSAVYAFAARVPLQERLIFGMGGVNVAIAGGLVTLGGSVDHLLINLAQDRRARVAVDTAQLEAGVRSVNDTPAAR